MTTYFYSKDHPRANGRTPIAGEESYTLRFPLQDGNDLALCCGRESFDRFAEMIGSMAIDDAACVARPSRPVEADLPTVIHKPKLCPACHCSQTLPASLQNCQCFCHPQDRMIMVAVPAPPADTALEQIHQIGTRALAEPGADTGTLVAICTLIEGHPADTAPCKGCNGTRKRSTNFDRRSQGEIVDYDVVDCPDCVQPASDTVHGKDGKPDHVRDAGKMTAEDYYRNATIDDVSDWEATRQTDKLANTCRFLLRPGDELTGAADVSLPRGFVDAVRNEIGWLKGLGNNAAEPVRE